MSDVKWSGRVGRRLLLALPLLAALIVGCSSAHDAAVSSASSGSADDTAGRSSTSTSAAGTSTTVSDEDIVVQAKDFKNLNDMTKVHSFYVDNLLGHLADAVKVANDPDGGMFPVGTVIQLVPQEAMVKRRAGFGPELNDWEFFTLTPSAEGTVITTRGAGEVLNRFGHQSSAVCHVKANIKFDFICEKTHGCDPLGIPDSVFIALQQSDPRPA